jgi:uncharacterized repeat protein (TIGR02543 family)
MKKRLFLLFILSLTLLLLASCGGDGQKNVYRTVSFDSNGAEPYQNRVVADGSLIIEPQRPTRVGYTFLGWYDGDTVWDFNTHKVTSDVTLKAKWERITYVIKFDSDGGTAVPEQTVDAGNLLEKPQDPTKKDHRFVGWYNGNDEWNFSVNRVTDHMTLKAKWELYSTYTVTFDSNGGTTVPSQYIVEGNKASLPTPPTKENSKFVGWYDGNVLWNFDGNTVRSNVTLTAKWEIIQTFTVTFNSNGGSPIEPQYIEKGGKATNPQTPEIAQLSRFLGWYYGDVLWNFDTVLTENITLKAKWENIYKISFNTDGAGEIPYVYVDEGKLIPPQEKPTKEGFRFIGWYVGNTKWNFNSDKVTSDLTLTARWEQIPTYAVTFDTVGGTADIPVQNVAEGGTVQEPSIPSKDNHRFDGWYAEGKLWDFQENKVTKPITLTAKWVELVTVTFDTGETSIKVTIDKGQIVAKIADPSKDGFVFRGWRDSNDKEWNFNTIVTENMTLTAFWKEACVVSFDTNGAGHIDPIIVGKGEYIEKPATPNKGAEWMFRGWLYGDVPWNFDTDAVTKSITLKAKWSIVLPIAPF